MRHQFDKIFSYQWGETGDYYNAHSIFKCQICNQEFTHWYHKELNIYKAMEENGIKMDECLGITIEDRNEKE